MYTPASLAFIRVKWLVQHTQVVIVCSMWKHRIEQPKYICPCRNFHRGSDILSIRARSSRELLVNWFYIIPNFTRLRSLLFWLVHSRIFILSTKVLFALFLSLFVYLFWVYVLMLLQMYCICEILNSLKTFPRT